jgi:hypothetical protein
MDTRARNHPGIILNWERGDMVLYPIAAGLDTTLTRASRELPRITSTELKASCLKARRFESQRVLLIYLPIENVRHSDVRFCWELVGSPFHCISARSNIPRISASQLKIQKNPRLTFALRVYFCFSHNRHLGRAPPVHQSPYSARKTHA